MITLFTIGAVAVVVAVLSLALDGVFDLPDFEWFSTTGLGAGVAMFCFTAGLSQAAMAPAAMSYAIGAVAALIVMFGSSWLLYKLRHAGTDADSSVATAIGKFGSVVVPIEVGRTGQVSLTVGGETVQLNAVAEEDIALSQPVRVVDVVSPTCVKVENLR
ncbi:MAG: hypothetical protein LBR32_07140 [Propionibacteriaceae bacterium]|jgi:drug/metabolite transporter (DMT)-like permease|nr:hypothetical protein [Propionibacteriaceae bacterium]